MQRVDPTPGVAMTLSQALGAPPRVHESQLEEMPPIVPSGPTLAEEREAVLEKARREGLRLGELAAAAGLEKQLREQTAKLDAAHEERVQALARQQQLVGELLESLPESLEELEARVLEDAAVLAFAAVTRIYGSAEADFHQVCVQLLNEQRERPVLLRVAPAMLAMVEGLANAHVRVEPAAAMAPGQAQLQTSSGITDGGLDVRLDAIRSAFLAGLAVQPR